MVDRTERKSKHKIPRRTIDAEPLDTRPNSPPKAYTETSWITKQISRTQLYIYTVVSQRNMGPLTFPVNECISAVS
jgi:hypothetical protein